ncbi:LysR family transcriptional regulator [Rhizobium sullae]|uniref:LysR family transcriptional regulator n=1 Tax=Rhizobium sullae TaxID=50338 RepID=UPI000B362064|nr:LysR family transcriptional regulator [Rhizobium sullae]
MDIRQIRIFKAVYEAGSIVGAGEIERSAPSVIAHHLANLEHSLKQPLFERSSRGVIPTPAGQHFYSHASAILRAFENAESDMRDQTEKLSGHVIIGMAFSAVLGAAMPMVVRLEEEQPQLRIDIAESVSGMTIERLIAADVDLALAYNPPRDPRLSVKPLLEEQMICVGLPELVGDPATPLSFEEFLTMHYVLTKKGRRGRPTPEDTDIQKRLEHNAAFYSENVAAALLFVNQGFGVMLATRANLEHGVFATGVIGREIVNPSLTRSLYLCERRDTPPSRSAIYIRDLILDVISKEIEAGRWKCRSLMVKTEKARSKKTAH